MNVHLLNFFDKKNVQDIFAGMYYDLHTHREVAGRDTKAILNRHGHFDSLVPGQWYSLGDSSLVRHKTGVGNGNIKCPAV